MTAPLEDSYPACGRAGTVDAGTTHNGERHDSDEERTVRGVRVLRSALAESSLPQDDTTTGRVSILCQI